MSHSLLDLFNRLNVCQRPACPSCEQDRQLIGLAENLIRDYPIDTINATVVKGDGETNDAELKMYNDITTAAARFIGTGLLIACYASSAAGDDGDIVVSRQAALTLFNDAVTKALECRGLPEVAAMIRKAQQISKEINRQLAAEEMPEPQGNA